MSKLTSKTRDKLPAKEFAGAGRSYPVPDKAHAIDAKARASQAVKVGRLSAGRSCKDHSEGRQSDQEKPKKLDCGQSGVTSEVSEKCEYEP